MKRLLILIVLILLSGFFFSENLSAQENPYVVLEYMHVKPDNGDDYLQIENFWKEIHLAQQKKGNILGWTVWEVVAPLKADDPYQFVVLTVYPRFSNFLHPYAGIELSKVFPNATKDSLDKMFSRTGEVRDLIQRDIFPVDDHVGNTDGDSINYLMATYVKVAPDKEKDFHSFMKNHWKPVVEKVVKNGFVDFWWYGSMIFHNGENAPYNHIMVVNWARDDMFDKEPPFDQYQKEDPAAFEGYKWSTRTRRMLLHKVMSLTGAAK